MKKALLQFTLMSALAFCFAVPVVDAATVKAPPANTGLVGYWSFNEGTSTLAGDGSGNGNIGTLTSMDATTDWIAGKLGKALDFDGTNDRVAISDSSSLDLSSSFTVSGWAKADSLFRTSVDKWNSIITKGDDGETAAANYNYALGYNGNSGLGTLNRWLFFFENSAGTNCNLVSASSANLSQWYHIAGVFDDTANTVSIYVDGVLSASASCSLTPNTNALSAIIGGDNNSAGNYWDGQLDDVRLYSRAFSASEITQLYRSGSIVRKTVSNSGLVGYWSFNEGTSTLAGDGSGNGNAGTLTNMDSATDWVPGKLGKALDFDGSNDHIVVSDSNTIDIGQGASATLAVWYYSQNDTAERIIYSKRSSDSSTATDYILLTTGSQLIFGTGSSADSCAWQTVSQPSKNEWHHIVGILSSTGSQSGTKRLYVDGVLVDSCTYSIKTASNSSSLYIGRPVASGSYWRGKVDDFRIYNRALTAAEVTTLYRVNETRVAASKNNFLTEGLVGMWSFDGRDMNYMTAYDRSGRQNHGTVLGMATATAFVTGKLGQALYFDGVNDLVERATPAGFPTGNNPFSYSAWIKPVGASSQQIIFYYGSNASNQSAYLEIGNCGVNQIGSGKWGATINCDPTAITPGQWYHVLLSYDGTTARLYRDGVLVDSDATSYNLVNTYYAIGRVSSSAYFNGTIDDVRVYNRALSASEAQLLYNSGR